MRRERAPVLPGALVNPLRVALEEQLRARFVSAIEKDDAEVLLALEHEDAALLKLIREDDAVVARLEGRWRRNRRSM